MPAEVGLLENVREILHLSSNSVVNNWHTFKQAALERLKYFWSLTKIIVNNFTPISHTINKRTCQHDYRI